jgi:vacuolar-type H+-ATPase subunit E/Vma4
MTLERRMEALLELVEADRVHQLDAILARARREAAAARKQAHAEARSRVRKAFVEARERAEARIAAAQAKLQTERRIARQRRAQALLAEGLRQLPAALLHRWREPESRRAWLVALAEAAVAVLPRTSWRVRFPSDFSRAELEAYATSLADQVGAVPQCILDVRIGAGLKIAADGNVVDGTLDGLLADRYEVGAKLLRAIEAAS